MAARRILAALLLLAAAVRPARAVSDDELRQYGFGNDLNHAVDDSRVHERPQQRPPPDTSIPPPLLPATTAGPAPDQIPPPAPPRLFPQPRGEAPPEEGPTTIYRGSEGKEMEGSFREVENFFLRPQQHFDHFLSMSEMGVTGLIQMMTGEVERQGSHQLRLNYGYTQFNRSFGSALVPGRTINQNLFGLTYMLVPARDVEASLGATFLDEQSTSFPFINDFSLAGIRDIQGVAKYRFIDNPARRVSAAFMFGIRSGIENDPTQLGSSGVDYMVGAAITQRFHNFGLHMDGGLIFANGQNIGNGKVPDLGYADLGADFQTSDHLDFIVELHYIDFQNIGTDLEITPGLKWKMNDKWSFDLGVPISLANNLAQGYNYRITSALQVRF